jgi:pantothenate kinase-related protein Tda10
MKTLRLISVSIFLVFAIQSLAVAQSTSLTETLKLHFNETVQQVHQAEHADEKREILNESFNKMMTVIDRIESRANLTEDELSSLHSYKLGIEEKLNELNGLDGFDEIVDEDLDDFSNFAQDFMEQANRTITIGITTALLIVLILLLL